MNTWEQFIKNQIMGDYPESLVTPIVEKTLIRYRRNQFESVGELIIEAKKELQINYLFSKGITVKDFAKKNNVSLSTARSFLKNNACARSKTTNNQWVYRG
jgi:CRISPR/Cas system CSM-associated protein Csm2 small subunit